MPSIRLPANDRIILGAFVRLHGSRQAARLLEVSENTLARALGELGILRVTATHLQQKLLEQPKPAA